MRFYAGAYWDVGARAVNEDSVLLQIVRSKRKNVALGLISDGIGGLSEGHIASGYVAEVVNERFYNEIVPLVNRSRGMKYLKRCFLRTFYEIADDLKRYGTDRDLRLGSTVLLILMIGRRYMLFNLGDCRAYLIRGGTLSAMNTIHSQKKGSVSRCIGSFPFMSPDITCGKIRRKSGILLASDGFYSLMDKDASLISPEKLQGDEAIEKMLMETGALIRKRGQKDNASAIYICCI
ncbi:MAG: protein phosphatase 2C domain-containing protein [Lachnospiraceae bacterium]|nr:protein phosphatase 2C domain-containing protein [Lachnospiraceae bacterium]